MENFSCKNCGLIEEDSGFQDGCSHSPEQEIVDFDDLFLRFYRNGSFRWLRGIPAEDVRRFFIYSLKKVRKETIEEIEKSLPKEPNLKAFNPGSGDFLFWSGYDQYRRETKAEIKKLKG